TTPLSGARPVPPPHPAPADGCAAILPRQGLPGRQSLPFHARWLAGASGARYTSPTMRNADLARVFRDLAAYLDMDDVPFKPRASEKAALAVEGHPEPLADVYRRGGIKALRAVPGIGASMATKLEELLTTGRCGMHEECRQRMPVDLAGLMAVEGV